MAQFTQVPIGTSNPVTLLDGLELLPGVMPARAGIQVSSSSRPFLDTGVTILFTRLKVSAYYQLLLGVVGPSIAFLFNPVTVMTQNQGPQGQVVLDFSGTQTINAQSGIVVGVGFSGGVHIVQELYLPARWYSPWKLKWTTVFERQLTYTVDLCQLLVLLIRYLINRSRNAPNGTQRGMMTQDTANTLNRFINGQTTWRLFDEVNGGFPASQTLSPAPRMTIPWNMVDYVPLLAQFARAMQAIKGDLFVGPTLSVLFPTTLRLDSLTVEGGQGAGSVAQYERLVYTSNTVTGSGPQFNMHAIPTRLTTRVNYQTQVGVLLSCLFQVSAAKIFSVGVNTPSLDLLRLLRLPQPSLGSINNSVSSQLANPPVVLVPQMTLSVQNANASPSPIVAGSSCAIFVGLRSPWPGPGPLNVSLSNDQNLPGFPSLLTIPVNADNVVARYTFPSRPVATGNPDQVDQTQSASPTLPSYTVRIAAQASRQQVGERAPDFENIQAIKVENPIMFIQAGITAPFQQAKGPVWSPLNGQYMNPTNRVVPDRQPPGFNYAIFKVAWTGAAPQSAVPVRFTLLNEEREPWTSSSVSLSAGSASNAPLRPAATATIGAASFADWQFTITWDSTGPNSGFTNRFIVTVDAGSDYGQDEVWLYLSEWS